MAHRYGREIGELMKLGQVDDFRAVRLIKDFADGLTVGVSLSPNQLLMIRDQAKSVAAAYAN
jgi:hypothetical protein